MHFVLKDAIFGYFHGFFSMSGRGPVLRWSQLQSDAVRYLTIEEAIIAQRTMKAGCPYVEVVRIGQRAAQ